MKTPLSLRQKKGLFVLLAAVAVGGLCLTRRFWIWLSYHLPPCLFHRVTGWYCPGCGNSRSVRALLSGQIWLSLRYNVFPVLAVIVFALWAAEQALRLFGRPHRLLPRSPRVIVPVGVLLGVYYVIRNIWEFMPV